MQKIFITGTGTNVGKTITSGLLIRTLSSYKKVAYMKPIQTGHNSDLAVIKKMCPQLINLPNKLNNPYHFDLPASPHLAAREQKISINLQKILNTVQIIEEKYNLDFLIIEGVGGLLVPLSEDDYMIDLLQALDCGAMVVGRCDLGTINHSLLSINFLKERKIKCLGLALTMLPQKRDKIIAENINFLRSKVNNLLEISLIENINQNKFNNQVLKFLNLFF